MLNAYADGELGASDTNAVELVPQALAAPSLAAAIGSAFGRALERDELRALNSRCACQ